MLMSCVSALSPSTARPGGVRRLRDVALASTRFEPIPPLTKETLPPLRNAPAFEEFDVVASPEWFGDGWNAFRQILVRRELAAMIVAASPRDFRIVEPSWA